MLLKVDAKKPVMGSRRRPARTRLIVLLVASVASVAVLAVWSVEPAPPDKAPLLTQVQHYGAPTVDINRIFQAR